MIELHLSIRLARHNRRSLLEAFQFVAAWARAEHGCHGAELLLASSDSCRLFYIERWKSEDEFRSMLRSHHFTQLIALAELALEFIGCEFIVITEIRGLGFAAEILEKTNRFQQLAEDGMRNNP